MTMEKAADQVGVTRSAWNDWEKGKRMPGPAIMVEIFRITGGAVAPNDFYALPVKSSACVSTRLVGRGEGAEGRAGVCPSAEAA